MKKQIEFNYSILWLELALPLRIKPLLGIRKDAFDLIWLGFQITYRYLGNGIVLGTDLTMKEYCKQNTKEAKSAL